MSAAGLLRLDADVKIEARAGDGTAQRLPRIEMTVYTGTAMRLAGWGHPVVLDLQGLEIPSQHRPIRFNHAAAAGVGHTERIAIEDGRLVAQGVISRDTVEAREVVAAARRGFPWQASLGAGVEKYDFVRQGDTVTVNAREWKGPLIVVRRAVLGEISLVDAAADGATVARIAARGEQRIMNTIDEYTLPQDAGDGSENEESIQAQDETMNRFRAYHEISRGHYPELMVEAMEKQWSPDHFRTVVREQMRASRPLAMRQSAGRSLTCGTPRETITAHTMLMLGRRDLASQVFGEQLIAGFQCPSGWPELAGLALRIEGRHREADSLDRESRIRAAFSTTSLGSALTLGLERVALDAYQQASSEWRRIARVISVRDFRPAKALRLSVAGHYEAIAPAGELKHADLAQDAYDIRAEAKGKIYSLTYQDMVNDDLQQLQQIPTTLGFDAARCIIDDVVTTLTGAGTFFSASNGNLLEGPTSALSIESLGAAVKALRTAEDRDGRTIGFVPTTLMIPAALEMTANEILNSTMTFRDQSVDNQASGNPFMNIKLYLYVEPQLDKTSTSAWYLFSPPQQGGAILVSFVAGKETPYIETSQGDFNTLGQKWRGWINSGCGLGDYRAVVRADGV